MEKGCIFSLFWRYKILFKIHGASLCFRLFAQQKNVFEIKEGWHFWLFYVDMKEVQNLEWGIAPFEPTGTPALT